ncbi:MAG: hypothetical protein DRJ68_01095 [Thermoprotei archaeon]|nr:MAG: hypothetical protein DRJ62_00570 [Thermoprotei archaeon]RLF22713.1 MAG: hypothetical protein DRJ68_01095 [Thermoprotei archaeon]
MVARAKTLSADEAFLKRLFRSYYEKWNEKPPKDFEKREFAFMMTKEGEMVRHKSFSEWSEVKEFLRRNAPLHVFYSSAYYLNPDAPDMDSKEWLGADLIFDIDVDHIPTPCKEKHDTWTCLNCGFAGRGMPPEECPNCSSKRIEVKTWFCDECLLVAKEEAMKLIEDFLIADFGFSTSEITVAFSGRRGFHVHVESDVVKELDQRARREIVDYVKGVGLAIAEGRGRVLIPPLTAPGWFGRVSRGVYEILSGRSIDELASSLGLKATKKFREGVELLTSSLERAEDFQALPSGLRKMWKVLVDKAVQEKRCEVDERVTTDIKRLIRMPGSLHGGSGLIVTKLSVKELETFDPLRQAVAFKKGYVKVRVHEMPEIRFLDDVWGPFRNEVVEIPAGLAVYLICSGNATIVKGGVRAC